MEEQIDVLSSCAPAGCANDDITKSLIFHPLHLKLTEMRTSTLGLAKLVVAHEAVSIETVP